jgi:hypothetical protein
VRPWQLWGKYQPVMKPGALVMPLVMTTLGLLLLPGMLTSVVAYRERLEALAHEIAEAIR